MRQGLIRLKTYRQLTRAFCKQVHIQYKEVNLDISEFKKFSINQESFRKKIMENVEIELYSNPETINQKKQLKDIDINEVKVSNDQVSRDKLVQIIGRISDVHDDIDSYYMIKKDEISVQLAQTIAIEHNCILIDPDAKKDSKPPVITIMGHVDHGKTSLLEKLRENTHIQANEAGGITQKIGAFHTMFNNNRLTYIDTPGHEAFVSMRVRGCTVTDMIVLVVSAVEGLQQQTLEVIELIKHNNVPLIVALNKIDIVGADPEKVEKDLYEKARLNLESYGGNISVIHISAKTGQNIDLLEELIQFEVELLNLKEDRNCYLEGVVIESSQCEEAQDFNATILIQKGTLHLNQSILIGDQEIIVRQITDDYNQNLKQGFPSYAVVISGLEQLAQTGETIVGLENEKQSKMLARRKAFLKKNKQETYYGGLKQQIKLKQMGKEHYQRAWKAKRYYNSDGSQQQTEILALQEQKLLEEIQQLEYLNTLENISLDDKELNKTKIDELKDSYSNFLEISQQMYMKEHSKELNLIIKAPDHNSMLTLVDQINQIKDQTMKDYEDIRFNLVQCEVGQISEADVKQSQIFKATIFGFNVSISPKAQAEIENQQAKVKTYKVIYELLNDLKLLIQDIDNEDQSSINTVGKAMVRQLFKVSQKGGKKITVAGIQVSEGLLNKRNLFNIIRDEEIIEENLECTSIKVFKKETSEVKKGQECVIQLNGFDQFEVGDVIENFTQKDIQGKINFQE